jgi:hypothetical protein
LTEEGKKNFKFLKKASTNKDKKRNNFGLVHFSQNLNFTITGQRLLKEAKSFLKRKMKL